MKNLKTLKYNMFFIKHQLFLLFEANVAVMMKEYLKKKIKILKINILKIKILKIFGLIYIAEKYQSNV